MYYLWIDGKATDPLSAEQVRSLAGPGALVSLGNFWVKFEEHPDFASPKVEQRGSVGDARTSRADHPLHYSVITGDQKAYQLNGEPLTVGRWGSDIVVDDESVSRSHAHFFLRDGKAWIRDLSSTNGTRVNGSLINGTVLLNNGDVVEVGRSRLTIAGGEGTSVTAVLPTLVAASANVEILPAVRGHEPDGSGLPINRVLGLAPAAAYSKMRECLIGEIEELEEQCEQVLTRDAVIQAFSRGFENFLLNLKPGALRVLGDEGTAALESDLREKFGQLGPQVDRFVNAYQAYVGAGGSEDVVEEAFSGAVHGYRGGGGVRGAVAVAAVQGAIAWFGKALEESRAGDELTKAHEVLVDSRERVVADIWDAIASHMIRAGCERLPNSYEVKQIVDRVAALIEDTNNSLASGNLDDAFKAATSAVVTAQGMAEAHFMLALVLTRMGRGEEALQELSRTRDMQPNKTVGWMLTAEALISLNRLQEALECAELAAAESPRAPEPQELVLKVLCLSKDVSRARGAYDRLISLSEFGSTSSRICQAMLQQASGDVRGAQGTLMLVLRENPDRAALIVNDLLSDTILAPVLESEEFSDYRGSVGCVRRVLEKWLPHDGSTWFFSPCIPKKKEDAARQSYANLRSGEKLLCMFDTTLFHGAKEGIAFTNWGIFFKNYEGSWGCVNYVDLHEPQIIEGKGLFKVNGIMIGETLMDVVDETDRKRLSTVIGELGRTARAKLHA